MRPDRFSLAKAWIHEERSTPEEAKATWDAMDNEFNENRKIFLASAESDALKDAINKKFGPGTIKYGSEIPQPAQRDDVIQIDLINAFMKRNPAAEGGQMVKPSVDGSRPGYAGPPVLNKKQQAWFDEKHFNNPDSKYYKIKWTDPQLRQVRKNILQNYANTLKYPKIPENYITTVEYAKKYNLPRYEVGVAQETDIIGNQIKRVLSPSDIKSGRTKTLTKDFLFKNLKPKKITTDKTRWYVKDDSKIAKEVVSYFNKTQLADNTMANITKVLKNDEISSLIQKGDYRGVVSALRKLDWMGGSEKANVMVRIAQAMGGAEFRDFNIKIKKNTPAANKLFRGLEKAQWGDPFADAYRNIKREVIQKGLGGEYFNLTYQSFLKKARDNLKLNGIDTKKLNLNINELTGLSSAYNNNTFSSSQFINLMDAEFNKNQHANLVKNYGQHEDRLQKALSGKRPNFDQAANEVKKWKTWKKDWFDNLDPRYKTNKIRSILPDFKITDKASKVFTEKRLEEFRKQNFPIAEEIKQKGYIKTFGTKKSMSETPLLKEIATGDDKALAQAYKQMIKLVGCPNAKAGGGRIEFAEGADCFDKGQKLINNGMKGASPASMRNAAKFLNSAYRFGRNVMKFGIVPEAIFVTGETLLRSLGDQTLEEGLKSSIGFYTDWTGLTDFKKDARISQNLRNMGVDATMNIERLVEHNDAAEKVFKLEENQKNNLAVWDESLMGSEADYKKQSDAHIAAAKKDFDNKFLREAEHLYYSQQQDTAEDIAGSRSPWKKFLGEARNKTENMRYEPDFSGMQSDMLTIDPMSAKAKKDSVSSLPPRSPLTGSKGETAFLNLSQLPLGPRMGSDMDVMAKAMNDKRVDANYLKAMQDYKQNYKDMTIEEMLAMGIPREAILGFNIAEPVETKGPGFMTNYKPSNRFKDYKLGMFSEGGITGLRSKYEYKK